jgi:methylmalonyl-CoA mutase N-terminal domain/subunit
VLGGTQSLHTNSRDEAVSLPTERSVQVALRTQQIIAHESGVANTIDPLAGSYYVEALTNEIESRAQEYIEKIDAAGGALAAIERGFIQREIQESAYRYQRAVEKGKQIVVGVNEFLVQEKTTLRRLKVDLAVQKQQVERLQVLRERRDSGKVHSLLTRLRETAQGDENLLPIILECVEAYVTLGEICGVLRGVFGEYKPSLAL